MQPVREELVPLLFAPAVRIRAQYVAGQAIEYNVCIGCGQIGQFGRVAGDNYAFQGESVIFV
jgi:hypothetical protein